MTPSPGPSGTGLALTRKSIGAGRASERWCSQREPDPSPLPSSCGTEPGGWLVRDQNTTGGHVELVVLERFVEGLPAGNQRLGAVPPPREPLGRHPPFREPPVPPSVGPATATTGPVRRRRWPSRPAAGEADPSAEGELGHHHSRASM